ncbi:DinB family protein [Actinospica sp.]|uniref:DinB family protein n=1 Tax=Actinospica sp. TaxID=1872142 RepID=UPI002D12E101|nr:DinB family protein [Actinospica sp.]HWG23358.1 DinB family protein [Actinospica sp.]
MIDEFAKQYLHDELRWMREALLWKLDGVSEYDVRRPLTVSGTNLLGLVKHVAYSGARYFGEVFDRPFPDTVPRWDEEAAWRNEHWAMEHESREEVVGLYRRVWEHADATIGALAVDAPGRVPWWPEPGVKLFNVMIHMLGETTRHAGHADILREQLDGTVGSDSNSAARYDEGDEAVRARRAKIERAARAWSQSEPSQPGPSQPGRSSPGPAQP